MSEETLKQYFHPAFNLFDPPSSSLSYRVRDQRKRSRPCCRAFPATPVPGASGWRRQTYAAVVDSTSAAKRRLAAPASELPPSLSVMLHLSCQA